MKEMVKYNNTLNTLQFKNFSAMDYNVLMCLCHKMRDQGDKELKFSFKELKELTDFGNHSDKLFAEDLDRMIDKLIKVDATVITGDEKSRFILFPTFRINAVQGTLTVSVNKDFSYILNEITGNFTKFELKEFAELDGKYTKTMYRIFKQYRKTGWWKPTVEEFKAIMDIPNAYTNKIIMRDIIKPTIATLSDKFNGLTCEPIKAKKRGAPIERYYFKWQAEKQIAGQTNINDAEDELARYNNKKVKKSTKKSNYNDFMKNSYDFEELEKKLVRN
ncbi:Protein involved in initiation of plasmid replication [Butyrivibrio fibrisolvens]|uniref:Protein involved in initiation of plasmid replication n=1 Tax=Butyrivibrio fibrisolvens TaxID=831 RepID=A0A1H9XB52_BUTFI|nr:replication initiation protein [Butyrivibrio fibrisolvens]SES43352.1 Protein involved in initiation of plasmid replication [Butyrivibrio fibrisolvens]